MPDYVEHRDGATEIGKLSAEAVVREYEAAAKDIEDLGAELVGHVKRCEAMTRDALTVIEELKETAGRYREEAKRVFLHIENCSLVTAEVRKTCVEMREKILASKTLGEGEKYLKPGDAVVVRVDGGYSHEFTTAQVHYFLAQEYGADYRVQNPERFAVFEDHLIYADEVPKMRAFSGKIETLRQLQREFQRHTGVLDYSAKDGISPGICHQVAREKFIRPGEIINATDSHTCMGGASNALTYGCGATEYAGLVHSGFTFARVPESIRFELHGKLPAGTTAKDLILWILWKYAREQQTLDLVRAELGETAAQQLAQALAAADQEDVELPAAEDVDPPAIEPTGPGSDTVQ